MGKIIAICGKICSGKSFYAEELRKKENAVILSCDELTKILFDNDLGDKHDEMSKRIWQYLLKISADIVKTNTNVILDWGFWTKENRKYISTFFKGQNINLVWHYIDIDEISWKKNIEERNKKVLSGNGGNDYFLDDGLMKKLLSMWEEPSKDEIDIWHKLKR